MAFACYFPLADAILIIPILAGAKRAGSESCSANSRTPNNTFSRGNLTENLPLMHGQCEHSIPTVLTWMIYQFNSHGEAPINYSRSHQKKGLQMTIIIWTPNRHRPACCVFESKLWTDLPVVIIVITSIKPFLVSQKWSMNWPVNLPCIWCVTLLDGWMVKYMFSISRVSKRVIRFGGWYTAMTENQQTMTDYRL